MCYFRHVFLRLRPVPCVLSVPGPSHVSSHRVTTMVGPHSVPYGRTSTTRPRQCTFHRFRYQESVGSLYLVPQRHFHKVSTLSVGTSPLKYRSSNTPYWPHPESVSLLSGYLVSTLKGSLLLQDGHLSSKSTHLSGSDGEDYRTGVSVVKEVSSRRRYRG